MGGQALTGPPPAASRKRRISLSHPYTVSIIATGASLVVNFGTGSLSAHQLGPGGRGELAAIMTWGVLVALICTVGFGDAMVYFQAKNEHDPRRVLGTALAVGAVLSVFGVLAAWLILPFAFSAQSAATRHLGLVSMLWIPACVGMAFTVGLVGGHQKFFALNTAKLAQPVLFAVGLVGLWASNTFTVRAVLAAFFGSYLLVFFGSLLFLLRHSGLGRPDIDLTRSGMSYGLRLQGHSLGTIGNARLDVMILPALVSAPKIGLYVVAGSTASIVVSLLGSLSQVVFPAASRAGNEAGMALVERTTRFVIFGSTLLSLVLAAVAPALITVAYGRRFHGAVILFDVLLPGSVLWAASAVLTGGLQAAGLPGKASRAQLIGLAVTIVGLAITVKPLGWGVAGAAITSTVAYSVTFAASLWYMRPLAGFSVRRTFSVRMFPGDVRWLLKRDGGLDL